MVQKKDDAYRLKKQFEKYINKTAKPLVIGIDVVGEFHYARAFNYRGIEFSKKPFKFTNYEMDFLRLRV